MATKITFRDQFHLDDFNDDENIEGESMTDESSYIPTEELIRKFLTGSITGTNSNLVYEVEGNKSEEQVFNDHSEREAFENEHANYGEEALRTKLKKTHAKIKEASMRQKKDSEDKKEPKAQKPGQPADLPPAAGGKGVQPAPGQAIGEPGVVTTPSA